MGQGMDEQPGPITIVTSRAELGDEAVCGRAGATITHGAAVAIPHAQHFRDSPGGERIRVRFEIDGGGR